MNPSPQPDLPSARWLSIAICIALVVCVVVIFAQNRVALQSGAAAHAGSSPAAASPGVSPGDDAARRAAIAQLGAIKAREGTNAAAMYHQANELYKQLSADDKKALKDRKAKLDPARVADLEAKIAPLMQLIRDARNANYIDWGPTDFTRESGQKQAEANGTIIALARVVQWDATYKMDSDPELAIQDLLAANAMASGHMNDPTEYTISCMVHEDDIGVLEENAGALTSLSAQDAASLTDNTWISQDIKSMADSSATLFQNLLNQYQDPQTHDEAAKTTSEPFLSGTGAPLSPQDVVAELQWAVQTLQQYGNSVLQPEAQYQQWSTQAEAESAGRPIGNMFYGSGNYFQMGRTYAESATVQYAMLNAGIALMQGNQAQFNAINDPATGQPFTVIQNAGGFQLSSPYKNYFGEQLIIPFGATPAK